MKNPINGEFISTAPGRADLLTEERAYRDDKDKPEFHLIPSEALIEIGKVLTFGAAKYEAHNWRKGMKWSRCYNSLQRHLLAFWDGEENDPETNICHLAHVIVNAIFLLIYQKTHKELDDRFKE